MAPSISSKSLKASTELTVIAKIKPGLVEIPDPMSYTTRLERLLEVLFNQRKGSVEVGQSGFVGPLETLRSLHFVHWAIIDSGTRLLLTVAFDKPFEPYIRSIVDDAGPLLDVIFFHCEGYENSTTRHGYLAFAEWVRARQQNTNFFFADFPELSVDDIRYLQKLKSLHDAPDKTASDKTASDAFPLEAHVVPPDPTDDIGRLLKTVLGLYRLKAFYPERGDARQANGGDVNYSDRAIFNRSVKQIAQGFSAHQLREENVPLPILAAYNDFKTWYHQVLAPSVPESLSVKLPAEDEIQGNILNGYDKMSDGCVALIKVTNAKALLAHLIAKVTTEATAGEAVKCNVSFTYNGLKALGLSQAELDGLPNEFREGMEARAGLLGDVGSNHPEQWSLPLRNWPEANRDCGRAALASVDAVVVIQTQRTSVDEGRATLDLLRVDLDELAKHGALTLHVQPLQRYASRWQDGFYREHFGYVDGISQPKPVEELALSGLSKLNDDGKPSTLPYDNSVLAGEVFVGLANDHGDVPAAATQGALLKNGSFLVMRKLAQNVDAFDSFVSQAASTPKEKDTIKGLLMGRKPDGTPLVNAAPGSDRNTFDYEAPADKAGSGGCPFQSHVRLANPRFPTTATVHGRPKRTPRITRRGFSYGPPQVAGQPDAEARAERGVMFMAYVANIAEQYEVIQRWVNGGNSTGLHSSQNDPIAGPGAPPAPPAAAALPESKPPGRAPFRFTESNGKAVQTKKLPPIPTPFVKLEWGLYLFAPSMTGLRRLAQAAEKPASPLASTLAAGGLILQALLAKDDPLEWKKILEGQGEREKAFAVWAAIRERGGVLKTKYGILVGREDYTLEVLKDESRFSAREYWLRMKASSVPMHLGMDAAPLATAVCPMRQGARPDQTYVDDVKAGVIDYERESIANSYLHDISRVSAFRAAYATTIGVMRVGASAGQGRQLADLYVVGEQVIARLSQLWFGIPDGTNMQIGGQMDSEGDLNAYCPSDFTLASQYIFRPNPDAWTIDLSLARGAAVTKAAAAFVQQQGPSPSNEFVRFLYGRATEGNPADRDAQVVRSLVGAVDGFVAANWGSFVTIIGMWLKNQDLWQVQTLHDSEIQSLAEAARNPDADLSGLLTSALPGPPLINRIFSALKTLPVPAWLHRTATQRTVLGSVPVEPGDRIVLNLSSTALSSAAPTAYQLLFGGAYSDNKGPAADQTPRHACPAQEMAIGVLAGMLVAVLERKAIRAEGGVAISFVALPPSAAPPKPPTAA